MICRPLPAGTHRRPLEGWGLALFGALLTLTSTLAFGQDAAPPVPDKGDTAWMMVSTAFVLMMAVPAVLPAQVRPVVPVRPAAPAPQPLRARIVGTVFDSAATQWLGGATVQLVDAANPSNVRTAVTTANGRFAIDSVAVGTYLIGYFHQRLDQLAIEAPLFRVNITSADELDVPMTIPSAETIITTRCGPGDPELPMGLYMGFVRTAATNQQVPAARVRAQYTEVTVGSRGVERRYPSRFGSSTSDGFFTLCGVPRNAPITARPSPSSR